MPAQISVLSPVVRGYPRACQISLQHCRKIGLVKAVKPSVEVYEKMCASLGMLLTENCRRSKEIGLKGGL